MTIDWGLRPATVLVALAALALCWVLPGVVRLAGRAPHPLAVGGAAAEWLTRKLNREHRGDADRAVRGALAVAFLVGVAVAAGWLIETRVATVRYGWIAELAVAVLLIDPRGTAGRARAAARLLGGRQPAGAMRRVVPRGEPLPDGADVHATARDAAERAARETNTALVGPLLWYLLLGLPALCAARMATEAARRMAGGPPSRGAFGIAAGGADAALGVLPAWLAGIAIGVASLFVPGARPAAALSALVREAGKAGPAGAPVTALAGALGLALGGPRKLRLADKRWREERPWIGTGRARVAPGDLQRAALFPAILSLFAAAALAAAWRWAV